MISSIFPVSLPYLQSTDYLYYPPLYYCVFPSQILRNLFQSSCSSLIRPLSKLNSIEDDRYSLHPKYIVDLLFLTTNLEMFKQ